MRRIERRIDGDLFGGNSDLLRLRKLRGERRGCRSIGVWFKRDGGRFRKFFPHGDSPWYGMQQRHGDEGGVLVHDVRQRTGDPVVKRNERFGKLRVRDPNGFMRRIRSRERFGQHLVDLRSDLERILLGPDLQLDLRREHLRVFVQFRILLERNELRVELRTVHERIRRRLHW